jgi:hypothetical protein
VPLKVRYALIAVPVLMASLDLLENGCIAVMLWTWPDLSHGLVEVSSLVTQVKIIAGMLTEVCSFPMEAPTSELPAGEVMRTSGVSISPALGPL